MRTSRNLTGGLAAVAALAAVLLAGCADGAGEDDAASPPPATPVTPTPSPPGTEPPPTVPVTPPLRPPSSIPSGELTISGDVVAGVEPNCTLLDTGNALYLLFGPAVDDLRTGTTATVRGEARADMASTCQQGTPFEVIEVLD